MLCCPYNTYHGIFAVCLMHCCPYNTYHGIFAVCLMLCCPYNTNRSIFAVSLMLCCPSNTYHGIFAVRLRLCCPYNTYRSIFAIRPVEGGTEEILVFDVNIVLSVSDLLDVSPEDGVLAVEALVQMESLLPIRNENATELV